MNCPAWPTGTVNRDREVTTAFSSCSQFGEPFAPAPRRRSPLGPHPEDSKCGCHALSVARPTHQRHGRLAQMVSQEREDLSMPEGEYPRQVFDGLEFGVKAESDAEGGDPEASKEAEREPDHRVAHFATS